MKDLNVKHGAMVTLEKYIIETFLDIDMGQDSLNMNMEKSTTKEKQDYIKLKSFCTAKKIIQSEETIYRMAEKIYKLSNNPNYITSNSR